MGTVRIQPIMKPPRPGAIVLVVGRVDLSDGDPGLLELVMGWRSVRMELEEDQEEERFDLLAISSPAGSLVDVKVTCKWTRLI
ncbi:hypothetical protein [Streptomyces mirabilis]|uniref:hypothetical protein n=1 Tax=Streptomyces mirabilis TaxID=68239 RepID=UPI0021C05EA8|nr:hypothetical protein [Streptomyces mirabilis]MCT9113971.1 hypothetical protein [Streptomyces mirabilis]